MLVGGAKGPVTAAGRAGAADVLVGARPAAAHQDAAARVLVVGGQREEGRQGGGGRRRNTVKVSNGPRPPAHNQRLA